MQRRAAETVIDTCRSPTSEARPHPAADTCQARGSGRPDPAPHVNRPDPAPLTCVCLGSRTWARTRRNLEGACRRVRHYFSFCSVSVCLFSDPILMLTLLLCVLGPVKESPELLKSIPSRKLELGKARVNQVSSHWDSHE